MGNDGKWRKDMWKMWVFTCQERGWKWRAWLVDTQQGDLHWATSDLVSYLRFAMVFTGLQMTMLMEMIQSFPIQSVPVGVSKQLVCWKFHCSKKNWLHIGMFMNKNDLAKFIGRLDVMNSCRPLSCWNVGLLHCDLWGSMSYVTSYLAKSYLMLGPRPSSHPF